MENQRMQGDGNPLYSLIFILYEQSINLGCKEADKDGNACRHEGAKYSPSEASGFFAQRPERGSAWKMKQREKHDIEGGQPGPAICDE